MTLEGAEPIGIAADGTLIDGNGNRIPDPAAVDFYTITVDDGIGGICKLTVSPSAVQILDALGNAIFDFETDGNCAILVDAGFATLQLSPGQTAANKNTLAIKNGNGDNIFQVRGDGSLHGVTGKALTFDL